VKEWHALRSKRVFVPIRIWLGAPVERLRQYAPIDVNIEVVQDFEAERTAKAIAQTVTSVGWTVHSIAVGVENVNGCMCLSEMNASNPERLGIRQRVAEGHQFWYVGSTVCVDRQVRFVIGAKPTDEIGGGGNFLQQRPALNLIGLHHVERRRSVIRLFAKEVRNGWWGALLTTGWGFRLARRTKMALL
jgi:hypothetical protein